jgi:hypothetical protein
MNAIAIAVKGAGSFPYAFDNAPGALRGNVG